MQYTIDYLYDPEAIIFTDLSTNTNLTSLKISNGFELPQIATTNLTHLIVYNIKSFDDTILTSKLQNLEILSLSHLDISNLDFISECTALTDLRIETCSLTSLTICNKLTSLVLIDILSLPSINILRYCTQLAYLEIEDCHIYDYSPLFYLQDLSFTLRVTEGYTTYSTAMRIHELYSPILSNINAFKTDYPCHMGNCDVLLNFTDVDLWLRRRADVKLSIYAQSYLNLLEKYNELSKFSTEPSFVEHIQDFNSNLTKTHQSFDEEYTFIVEEHAKLKEAYTKLEYAPHGPVYTEALKLFI